jgi:hypothetical protein
LTLHLVGRHFDGIGNQVAISFQFDQVVGEHSLGKLRALSLELFNLCGRFLDTLRRGRVGDLESSNGGAESFLVFT